MLSNPLPSAFHHETKPDGGIVQLDDWAWDEMAVLERAKIETTSHL